MVDFITHLIAHHNPSEFKKQLDEKLEQFADRKQYPKVDVHYSCSSEGGELFTALIIIEKI